LSAQMIVRYWKNFPEQRNSAFYALISILEDRDPQIRKVVIREMSHLVKAGQLVDKIADVLSQMLQQTDESQEITLLTNALAECLKCHPKEVLSAIFLNIIKSDEESIRIRLLKFINEYLPTIPTSLMNSELKDEVENYFRKILKDVTALEFDLIFDVLRSLETYKSVKGRITLFKIVIDQIGLDQPFPVDDIQRFDQILYFVEKAQTLLSQNCRSTGLVDFLVSKGIPRLDETSAALRHRFLRALADMVSYAKTLDESRIKIILNYFLGLIPLMPSEKEETSDDCRNDGAEVPQLKLSELEAVTIILFVLFKANRSVFDALQQQTDENILWRKRVVYLARLLQQYITVTNSEINLQRDSDKSDKNHLNFLENTLSVATNILKLVKEFLHKNPSFSSMPSKSWKTTILISSNLQQLVFIRFLLILY
uniref:Cnd1 domain-containing protein n=1 Tax=Dracunculus medinensis TaxID=318479 RepID=A0A158Q6F1_DRAME